MAILTQSSKYQLGALGIIEALSATWPGCLVATGLSSKLFKCENRQFEEVQPQVCGAVSKAEEEELCSKQLELVIGKLSHPGVSASTMADCMVCIILHSIAFVKILSRNLSGADHPYGTFGL